MRIRLLFFLLLYCNYFFARGQEFKTDSLVKLDAKLKVDTLIRPIVKAITNTDSLTNKANTVLQKSIDFTNAIRLPDSVRSKYSSYNSKVDSIKRKLTHRIDSLNLLKLPADGYSKLLDSLQKTAPVRDIQQAEANLQKLEKKINAPIEKLNNRISDFNAKINAKFNELNKESVDLPTNASIPNAQNKLGVTDLSTAPTPAVIGNPLSGIASLSLGGKELGVVEKEMQAISTMPEQEIAQLKNTGAMGEISKELKSVGQFSTKAKVYSNELKDLSKGEKGKANELSKDLEKRVSSLKEVHELQGNSASVKDMLAKGQSPEELKKMALAEVNKEAVNHFGGQAQVLQVAMADVSKYKMKMPSLTSINDLTKRVYNEMRHKPLRERLLVGLNFQFQSKGDFISDINPWMSFRLSGKWAIGSGWVERVQFHTVLRTVPQGRIYGPRAFTEVKFKKGIYARIETECINTYVPDLSAINYTHDTGGRKWLWGFFVGMKKDYRFSKRIRGNIQVLYNISNYIAKISPYTDKISVRMGFEFNVKRRQANTN